MGRKPKYKYDIEVIKRLENFGWSVRSIAREHEWCESNTQEWIKRNYDKVIKIDYIPKKKINKGGK